MRVSEKNVLRLLEHNKEKTQRDGGGENHIMRRLMTCVLRLRCLGVWDRREVQTLWEDGKCIHNFSRETSKEQTTRGRRQRKLEDKIKINTGNYCWGVTRIQLPKIWHSGGLLWVQISGSVISWTPGKVFTLHKAFNHLLVEWQVFWKPHYLRMTSADH